MCLKVTVDFISLSCFCKHNEDSLGENQRECCWPRVLPPRKFILTLISLRLLEQDVAYCFSVSQSTRIIITWIDYLFLKLKEIPLWPPGALIKGNIPKEFKSKYSATRSKWHFPITRITGFSTDGVIISTASLRIHVEGAMERIKNFHIIDRSLIIRLTDIADRIFWFVIIYLIFIHHFVLDSNCRIYIFCTQSNLNIISNTISNNHVCSLEELNLWMVSLEKQLSSWGQYISCHTMSGIPTPYYLFDWNKK